ncbi:hypothetical protein BABINDRAFT_163148 [Babjeviella inositovora NRRL Y-12698]|uniref:Protein DOM34 homolog n=1 Tax=Babjeviella inositovora NRRL Y-12698 TaxID=984486 RepID=A0A1E3QJ64_9ASCO|nr:uncharacterized protein BABINDRAFT_163148 [Babjeviella inositovora NRRL Y-12698]ODQ77746.1 hypothetical protein BABINDRAFT_163148 [Babjeviella inositovora NRRL Y-12698]
MKLVKQNFEKDASGIVVLVPQDKEDLWALYNLIQKADEIELTTVRNVKKSKDGKSGKTERKVVKLRIAIETVDFASLDESMRIRGQTVTPNDDVPLNSYHTAQIEYNHPFTLWKPDWDQVAYDIIAKACQIGAKAELGAVVLQEGVAHLCLITESMTVLVYKHEKAIPKKRRGDSSAHDKAMDRFLTVTAETMARHFDLQKLKAVLVASPGFVAQSLYDKFFELAVKQNDKAAMAAKLKFVIAHCSTGYLQGLEEALKSPEVQKQLSDTKSARAVMVLDEFFDVLNQDNGKAWYGDKECAKAVEMGAVKTLLITDTLFRSDDIPKRKHYIALTEAVKVGGGEVFLFSSLHDSGEQLDQLTGIACLLNYPVPDLDEE